MLLHVGAYIKSTYPYHTSYWGCYKGGVSRSYQLLEDISISYQLLRHYEGPVKEDISRFYWLLSGSYEGGHFHNLPAIGTPINEDIPSYLGSYEGRHFQILPTIGAGV